MTSIRQHIPNFVSGVDPETVEFKSLEELLAIPWVAQWAERTDGKDFHRFSQSDNMLMAEYVEGYNWLVVGYLSEPVDLPMWEAKRREKD